jgi:hypothetical protein
MVFEEAKETRAAGVMHDEATRLATYLRRLASTDYTPAGDCIFDGARLLDDQYEAISRVRALHTAVPVQFETYSVCSACITQTWPCATIAALAGAGEPMSEPPRSVSSRG